MKHTVPPTGGFEGLSFDEPKDGNWTDGLEQLQLGGMSRNFLGFQADKKARGNSRHKNPLLWGWIKKVDVFG